MNDKKVWIPWKLEDVPRNRKLLECRWVFNLKKNGTFRSRLVAKGFKQEPGVDFFESFAAVVNDTSVRCLLILALQNDWKIEQIDVETAFLY